MTYSVVIIEDELEVAQLLAQYLLLPNGVAGNQTARQSLRQGQYQVVGIAANLSTATALLQAIEPDLILLDIHLPDGNGLELLTDLRRRSIKSEVMLLTAAKEVETLEKAMQLGACDFLVKPLMLNRLDQALARFESRQQCLSDANEVTQSMVDTLFGSSEQSKAPVRLPKGVDQLTLKKIIDAFKEHKKTPFTAQQMGDLVGVSRSTARRYLEYLLEAEQVSADQSYGSIGRPERCYKMA
ncbi:response regulator [Pseudoalteromonas sp. SR44-5]|uniref:Transcriptional regulatory protein n=1 Tax=Pseudoalteromonas rhizosphaerae TaxID=2518973 RepID=A0ABW8KST9_9GAMM|nr:MULTISPECIES: response regulator [Pseudoalteromonas]MBB1292404.1 response regulator [Pseudoalteromonas sp. SR41-4]MBB1299976.1 response regulator [Pseudoalteromonas sp. SR44-8]MBB1309148.1 response regulator [Pseudoalteromonas sp. SR41-8]MBB1332299.1 response regulator [Pseudoalteromonas sp. SR41-6]MBB1340692.1 response regulator [Pseudoalteromonas sp. SR45-6]|tara:strand:+ start:13702 stop:14424 length:723 start_codon:yes stop_codon:yes gene_type:complete